MGILKWICSKFSCKSSCKYNDQMAACPQTSIDNVSNIMNYQLSIKDIMKFNKILNKRELKQLETLTYPTAII